MEKIEFVDSSFWEFKGLADSTDKKFLMSSPFPIIFIVFTYLWLVLKFGPEFMKNRKPYKLDKLLAIYNLIQVMACAYIISLGLRIVSVREAINMLLNNNSKCHCEIKYIQVTDFAHCYFLVKVVDLLDTVFFVLRKKQSQVSFLHVYHHSIMTLYTWVVVKYYAQDSILFIGITNSMVHVIMYSYYGLSVFPALTKYLWWKKYITIIQMIQFCLIISNIIIGHFMSDCKKANYLLFVVVTNNAFFFYLFRDFYIKSYTKESNTRNDLVKVPEVTPKRDGKNGLNNLINNHKLAAKIN